MNSIKFGLCRINQNESIKIEGILFSGTLFIELFIDHVNILHTAFFEEGVIVFKELEKSTQSPGDFLIFTSINGIADEGGWDYVNVLHNETSISWHLIRDGVECNYTFNKTEYIDSINQLKNEIGKLNDLTLQPIFLMYPE